MQKLKLLAIFMASLSVLAVAATPASAFFEATNGRTSGPATAGSTTLTQAKGNSISCSKAVGAWVIRSTGKVFEQTKGPGQQITKQGPHQDISVSKWEGCFANAKTPVVVEPCVIQIAQPKGASLGWGSVVTQCQIIITLAPGIVCNIHVSPSAANEILNKVNVTKGPEETTVATAAIENLTNTFTSTENGCGLAEIDAESTNKFTGSVKATGERLV